MFKDRASISVDDHLSQKPRLNDLPDVLTPRQLRDLLPLGRNAIYELLQAQKIRNIRVGQKFIVTKGAVEEFLLIRGESATSPGPTI